MIFLCFNCLCRKLLFDLCQIIHDFFYKRHADKKNKTRIINIKKEIKVKKKDVFLSTCRLFLFCILISKEHYKEKKGIGTEGFETCSFMVILALSVSHLPQVTS